MLKVYSIINQPVPSNCFVLYDKAIGNNCIIVDPGSERNNHIYQFLKQKFLLPEYIILTHEHFDHCWGVNDLRDKYKEVKLVCSSICSEAIHDKKKNYSVYNEKPGFEIKPADVILDDVNWEIKWHQYILSFKSAPGHSDSGILFFIDNLLFTGDSLIKGIKIVTKLKTGSKFKLKKTILMISNEKGRGLIACPGHGLIFKLDDCNLNIALK